MVLLLDHTSYYSEFEATDHVLESIEEISSELMVGHGFKTRFVSGEIGRVENDLAISQ